MRRSETRQKVAQKKKRAEWNWPAPFVLTFPQAGGSAMQCSVRKNSVSAGWFGAVRLAPAAEKIKFGGNLHVGAAAFRYQDS
jgi:hypothetical protein